MSRPCQFLTWLLLGLGLSGEPRAAVKIPLYDDFSGTSIDTAKWIESESARFVGGKGSLTLGRYLFGATASDVGTTDESFNLSMANPAPALGLKATVTVDNADVGQLCPANPTPSSTNARLMGSYFNTRPGGPLPGDRTGDVVAQIRLIRSSDSVDAPGVLLVQGFLITCTNVDCSTSDTKGKVASLGTTTVGTQVKAQILWSAGKKRFTFTRDGNTSVNVAYTDADNVAPAVPLNEVSIRNKIANCTAGRIKGGTMAHFDDIGIAD